MPSSRWIWGVAVGLVLCLAAFAWPTTATAWPICHWANWGTAGQQNPVVGSCEWYVDKFSAPAVAAVGVLIAGSTFTSAVYQAIRAQTWKRKEFVAEQMASFFANPSVKAVLLMLDYSEREIDVPRGPGADKWASLRIDQGLLAAALLPHELRDRTRKRPKCDPDAVIQGRPDFSPEDGLIRDAFDVVFDRLDTFNAFIEAKLIKLDDIQPYLMYWLESIADTDCFLGEHLRRSLRLYIDAYEFRGVQKLCALVGCPIALTKEDIAGFKRMISGAQWASDSVNPREVARGQARRITLDGHIALADDRTDL